MSPNLPHDLSHRAHLPPLPEHDLDHVLNLTAGDWERARGKRLFITGGTGFFGIWLLESFLHAEIRLRLGAKIVVLTRSPETFIARVPHLAEQPSLEFHGGDMTMFDFPQGKFDLVIHAATQTVASSSHDPLDIFERNVLGTRRVLEFARQAGTERLLLTSSGAVYGRQPPDLERIPEEYPGAPETSDPSTFYGQSKRISEFLCAAFARRYGFESMIARCFAFVGPHLPLSSNYAIGNFLRDALAGGPIRVTGDGTPRRSYLYAADLAAWLWVILFRGASCRAYNVGSEDDISIADLAQVVSREAHPRAAVSIASTPQPDQRSERYVPSTHRAVKELGLRALVSLPEGIRRTATWYADIARRMAIPDPSNREKHR